MTFHNALVSIKQRRAKMAKLLLPPIVRKEFTEC